MAVTRWMWLDNSAWSFIGCPRLPVASLSRPLLADVNAVVVSTSHDDAEKTDVVSFHNVKDFLPPFRLAVTKPVAYFCYCPFVQLSVFSRYISLYRITRDFLTQWLYSFRSSVFRAVFSHIRPDHFRPHQDTYKLLAQSFPILSYTDHQSSWHILIFGGCWHWQKILSIQFILACAAFLFNTLLQSVHCDEAMIYSNQVHTFGSGYFIWWEHEKNF